MSINEFKPSNEFEFSPKTARFVYGTARPEGGKEADIGRDKLPKPTGSDHEEGGVASRMRDDTPHPASMAATVSSVLPPKALLICHGMGQQVRFETIGQIANSILAAAGTAGCAIAQSTINLARQNDSVLARAELHWTDLNNDFHTTHIYEAYWAPVTEGKVTYGDTLKFLFSAAWKGLKSSFPPTRSLFFERFLFGAMQQLPILKRTFYLLLILTAFLLAQAAIGAVILAKLAEQLKQINAAHYAITNTLLILLPGVHSLNLRPFSVGRYAFALSKVLGWYALVAEVLLARYFIIQYIGDVAAYISPYKASKFQDIRDRIQAIGLNVAKVIYGFDNVTPVPNYSEVIFAGHSLGSILAYDTLNGIINWDLTSSTPGSQNVFGRTKKLITFGSPLDKTAFLFRNQSNHVKDPLREQMATAFQPLIRDYTLFRKQEFWTNLYSPNDIISGALVYYDFAAPPGFHVQNLQDPAGTIPLYAHVQYWTGALLANTLYGLL